MERGLHTRKPRRRLPPVLCGVRGDFPVAARPVSFLEADRLPQLALLPSPPQPAARPPTPDPPLPPTRPTRDHLPSRRPLGLPRTLARPWPVGCGCVRGHYPRRPSSVRDRRPDRPPSFPRGQTCFEGRRQARDPEGEGVGCGPPGSRFWRWRPVRWTEPRLCSGSRGASGRYRRHVPSPRAAPVRLGERGGLRGGTALQRL